jgi:hypothetical protein
MFEEKKGIGMSQCRMPFNYDRVILTDWTNFNEINETIKPKKMDKLERIKKIEKELEELKKEVKAEELPSITEIDDVLTKNTYNIVVRKRDAFEVYLKVAAYLNDGWDRSLTDGTTKYYIQYNGNDYDIATVCSINGEIVHFKSKELAQKCIKIAKHLEKELGYNFLDVLYKD